MPAERSPFVDYAIITLLFLNLGVTSYVAFRPAQSEKSPQTAVASEVISESEAEQLASQVVKPYNAKDNEGLYARFDSLAKAQISKEALTTQMEKLYPVMAEISDVAFSSAVVAGSDGGRDYYNLLYKVRLSGSAFESAELKLVVTRREGGLGLVGFFLNANRRRAGINS